jgi:hypothetical protein
MTQEKCLKITPALSASALMVSIMFYCAVSEQRTLYKKVSDFPFPSRDVTNQILHGWGIIILTAPMIFLL